MSQRKKTMCRVLITIPDELLAITDEAARKDYSSRSGVIRAALLSYLCPQDGKYSETELKASLKTFQRRKLAASIRKSLRSQ